MENEKRDCHYCANAMCINWETDVDCYAAENGGAYDHHVEDSTTEASGCKKFVYCDTFPK